MNDPPKPIHLDPACAAINTSFPNISPFLLEWSYMAD